MPEISCIDCDHPVQFPCEHDGCGPLCRECYRDRERYDAHAAAQARIAQLEAELAEARKDSARYQWIRRESIIFRRTTKRRDTIYLISFPTVTADAPKDGGNYRDRFDAAIDAKMEPHV